MKKIKLYNKKPYPHQNELHNHIGDYIERRKNNEIYRHTIIIKSPRQIAGKTTTLIAELIRFSFEFPKSVNVYISIASDHSKKIYNKITTSLKTEIKRANGVDLEIEFKNGSIIKFFTSGSRSNLRSYTVTGLLCMDECAFMSDDTWGLHVSPWASVHSPLIIMASTPFWCEGFYYDHYNLGKEKSDKYFTYDWCENEYIYKNNKELLDDRRKTLTDRQFKTEYLGEWLTEDDGNVFQNVTASIKENTSYTSTTYYGLDWGTGDGNDATVLISMNEKREMIERWSFRDMEPTIQVEKIKEKFKLHPPTKVCADGTSIGKIYKSLFSEVPNIEWINFSNTKKQQLVQQLILSFQNNDIFIIKDEELLKELSYFSLQKTPTGKVTYNASKGNDDIVTALYLAIEATQNKISIGYSNGIEEEFDYETWFREE